MTISAMPTWSTVPGAGHLSNLEAPEAFDQALLAFLATFDRA